MQFDSTTTDVVSTQACVVYDTNTGEVLHIHEITALEGGYIPTERELEQRTLELAGPAVSKAGKEVQTLVVDPESIAGGESFRVDIRSRRVLRS